MLHSLGKAVPVGFEAVPEDMYDYRCPAHFRLDLYEKMLIRFLFSVYLIIYLAAPGPS